MTGQRHLDELTWGLLPHSVQDPSTAPRPGYARAETVAALPYFQDAFAKRRAIIPADVYYQRATLGDNAEKRFAISRHDKEPMAWAGLWGGHRSADGRVTRSYCVLTVEAIGAVAAVHDRMPLILDKEDWSVWLGEQDGDLNSLLVPRHADAVACRVVGRRSAARR